MVTEYLEKGDLFTLYYKDELAALAVVLPIDEKICELKNIITLENYRGMGLGKQGFDKYEKTIKNYFVDNYDEEIIDGDIHCIDMYYYSKDLKR